MNNNKKTNNYYQPLRQKPDYGYFDIEERMKEISKQIYKDSSKFNNIVISLYLQNLEK